GKAQLIPSLAQHNRLPNQPFDVITAVQHQAAALLSDNLQAYIAKLDVAWLSRGAQEVLVVGDLADILRSADRVDRVHDDVGPAELCADGHDLVKDGSNLGWVQLDPGAAKQRPSWRDPDNPLGAFLWQVFDQGLKVAERYLEAL